jgi:hypothetical protein
LNTTDRAFKLVVSDSRWAGLLRTRILARVAAFAMRFERVQRIAFGVVSQTGIQYRSSALSETAEGLPDDAPRAGDRFPWLKLKLQADGAVEDLYQRLDDLRFHLLVIGQPAPAENTAILGDLLCIHAIPADPANDVELARMKVPAPSFYLVRPDGYIGLCGVRADAATIANYVSARLHIGARRVRNGT